MHLDGASFGREGLELLKFDGGMEIRVAGRNKGRRGAHDIARDAWPSRSRHLRDDQTDEDAFAALQGYGLGVLVGSYIVLLSRTFGFSPQRVSLLFLRIGSLLVEGAS